MVGRALVIIVPSRADMRPVIIRDAMIAQKRHDVRIVVLSWAATWVVASSFVGNLPLGVVVEWPDVGPRDVVCTSAGCSSCVAMLSCLDQVFRQWLEGVGVLSTF